MTSIMVEVERTDNGLALNLYLVREKHENGEAVIMARRLGQHEGEPELGEVVAQHLKTRMMDSLLDEIRRLERDLEFHRAQALRHVDTNAVLRERIHDLESGSDIEKLEDEVDLLRSVIHSSQRALAPFARHAACFGHDERKDAISAHQEGDAWNMILVDDLMLAAGVHDRIKEIMSARSVT